MSAPDAECAAPQNDYGFKALMVPCLLIKKRKTFSDCRTATHRGGRAHAHYVGKRLCCHALNDMSVHAFAANKNSVISYIISFIKLLTKLLFFYIIILMFTPIKHCVYSIQC